MRKFFNFSLLLLLILVVVFFLGPRPKGNLEVTFSPKNLSENLDEYLLQKERKVSDLIAGAEKEIIWANPETKAKTKIALIYIHGFSGTKEETRPLSDIIARNLDANLYYTRLEGHGQNGVELEKATLADWANDYAEAIAIGELIGEKIVIISASTGASLATWGLSQAELTKNVLGMASISANYELQGLSTSQANMPWAEIVLPAIAGHERSWIPQNPAHAKWWTTTYPSKSVFPMMVLLKELKGINKSLIKTPALFIYSPNDKVIIPSEIEKVAMQWGGPTEVIQIDKSRSPSAHVLAGDILNPGNTELIANQIITWIKSIN